MGKNNQATLLRQMIDKAFITSIEETLKIYQKTEPKKRISDAKMKELLTHVVSKYKSGIMHSIRLHGVLENLEENKKD